MILLCGPGIKDRSNNTGLSIQRSKENIMVKKFEVVVTITGDGTDEKQAELVKKVVDRIKVEGQASLGNLQASTTVVEK